MEAKGTWEHNIRNVAYILNAREIYIFSINEREAWPIDNIAFFKTTGHNKRHEEFRGTLLPILGSVERGKPPPCPLTDSLMQVLEDDYIIKFSSVKDFIHDTKQRPKWQCDMYNRYFSTLHNEAFLLLDIKAPQKTPTTLSWNPHQISVCELMLNEIGRLDTLFSYFLFDWQLKISIRTREGFWRNELGRKFVEWYSTIDPYIVETIPLEQIVTDPSDRDKQLYPLLDSYKAQITHDDFIQLKLLTQPPFFVEQITAALYTQLFTASRCIDQQKQVNERLQTMEAERAARAERLARASLSPAASAYVEFTSPIKSPTSSPASIASPTSASSSTELEILPMMPHLVEEAASTPRESGEPITTLEIQEEVNKKISRLERENRANIEDAKRLGFNVKGPRQRTPTKLPGGGKTTNKRFKKSTHKKYKNKRSKKYTNKKI